MGLLIDDMLTFARVGTKAIDPETVALAPLIESCWTSLERRNATLRIETDRRIRADRERLRQVMENLLSNAVSYGGTDVSITVGALDDGFHVEDDGSGVPPDERMAVFEAGYSPGRVGTGFGLSIVEGIVEAHQWDIRVVDGGDGGARSEITGVETVAE